MKPADIKIKCEDGIELAGSLFQPTHKKSAVLIGPATGIKRQFYASFATFLSENGFLVLTFDNRGIGDSKGENLNKVNASLVNWGILDLTAALDFLKSQAPQTDYHLIGHSAGGQLVGLMKNGTELKSMFNYGSSSGSLQYAKYPFKFQSSFYLNIYIPVSNLIFGQTQSQWVGMGEPLPKEVGKQWRRWCNGKGYVLVDLDKTIKKHIYNQLTFKTLWLHASDDQIANIDAVKDMTRVFSRVSAEIKTIYPQDYGYKELGHMKFFSSKKKKLWDLAIDWLNSH